MILLNWMGDPPGSPEESQFGEARLGLTAAAFPAAATGHGAALDAAAELSGLTREPP